MHTLAANWGWLLALAVVFAILAVFLQVRNMRKLFSSTQSFLQSPTGFGQPAVGMDGVIRRMVPVFICGIGAGLTALLTVVGIVANLMGK